MSVVTAVTFILLVVGIPALVNARQSAQDAVAISSTETVAVSVLHHLVHAGPPVNLDSAGLAEFQAYLDNAETDIVVTLEPSTDPNMVSVAVLDGDTYLAARSASGNCVVTVARADGTKVRASNTGPPCSLDDDVILALNDDLPLDSDVDPEDPDDPDDPDNSQDPQDPDDPENSQDPQDPQDPEDPDNSQDPENSQNPDDPDDPVAAIWGSWPLGDELLFSYGDASCGTGLAIDTDSRLIYGPMHTNSGFRSNGGGPSEIHGPVSYVGALNAWPPTQFLAGHGSSSSLAPPTAWQTSDFAPGSARAEAAGGDYHHWPYGLNAAVTSLDPGLHYVFGNVNVYPGASGDVVLEGITIIATGSIQISGGNITMTPYDPSGLTLFANSNGTASCWGQGIALSTSNLTFEGALYAPNGRLAVSTATTTAVSGGLHGYAIQVTGNSLVVHSITS